MAQPILSLIVARGENGEIGRGNDMPWHVPADLRYFKATTQGKPVIMGRKTFQSIFDRLGKPLPNRHSVVISRGGYDFGAVPVFNSLADAYRHSVAWAANNGVDEIFIGGGAEIYKQAMPYVQRAYITEISVSVPDADAHFPALADAWQPVSAQDGEGCRFTIWENSKAIPL